MFAKLSAALLLFTAVSSVSAHGALVAVTGTNGVDGQGFGVVDSTPRDGTRRNPFQVHIHDAFP
ncbi:CAS1 protein [Rhizoctonia solani AG-3 Rhs1AP]|uniref:CAS1 protein n=2 Tax=Rhizoctonia solani AG-3 TaxID=1086053 RepID=A0A074RKJ7_9AGAM|nr:CAS1 protein [Rhizoctonia solani AG-3 Rhs1AP]KEP45223.1 CAS1 protein [Rhizoctonia solani 123E]